MKVIDWLVHLLYPSSCIACRELLNHHQAVCSHCAHELELISPIDRCSMCFTPITCSTNRCPYCLKHPPHHRLFGRACCVQESHAIRRLLSHVERCRNCHIEAALASLAYLQHHTLKWPQPDLVVLEPSHWLSANRNTLLLSARIGKQLAALFNVPCRSTHLNIGSLSAPHLELEKQYWHEGKASVRTKRPFHGMNILTFSLSIQKGSSFDGCIHALEPHGLCRVWNLGLVAKRGSWMED